MLTIDGSAGEGGGQILRTALALSIVTRTPLRLENVRAGRERPGLLRQHLAAVKAAAEVSGAEVEGAELGSTALAFSPGEARPGTYRFSVGSAGSATLVLQTVLPGLLTASGPSTLEVEGGTHNPFAPPFDFLAKTFLPLVNRMGPRVEAILVRPGFYPAGGGSVRVRVEPAARLRGFDVLDRGPVRAVRARALLARLPRHIAERELSTVARLLRLPPEALAVEEAAESPGPGNAVVVEVESEALTEVFTAFGQRGVRAERVAENAAGDAKRYLDSGVPVGDHLADQLLLPLALAGGGSFRCRPLSSHATTNLEVLRMFLPVEAEVEDDAGGSVRVSLRPRA